MSMEYQNFASLGVNLNRQKYGPLDISNVFTSENDLKYYLTKGEYTTGVSEYWYKNANEKVVPYPYEGQVLATVIDGVVSVFALSLDAEGKFQTQEIGAKIEVDGTTIVKDAEGKLSIVAPVNPDSTKSYNFSYANGKYSWVEVDTATAAGQAQAIAGLESRVAAVETGVADNAQAVIDEASARDAADKVIEGKIADALQAAKDYADENDANTIYDDKDVKARLEAIESDYLKAEDKYVDTDLQNRVKAIEDDYLKEADKYDDTDVKARIKALEDEERYDDTELSGRVQTLEGASNDHATRIAAMESFWDATEDSDGIVNKLKEIQDYIASDETGAAAMAGDIKANADAIKVLNGDAEGSVNKKIADAIAPLATTQALNEVSAVAEAAQTAEQVSGAITEALKDYAKTADVVDTDDFDAFKAENTSAIATAKQAAIEAAAAAEAAKGYAVASEVADTYATKAALNAHAGEITNELAAYAKTADVNVELAKKIEGATIAHTTDSQGEEVKLSTDGKTLNIYVDAYTKAETLTKIEEKITEINGGESAGEVLSALNSFKETTNAEIGAIKTKNSEQETAIAKAQEDAAKGINDAKKVSDDLVIANNAISKNAGDIKVVEGTIGTVNETLSGKIGVLETTVNGHDDTIKSQGATLTSHGTTIAEQGGKITALEAKDTDLAGQISAVDSKFTGYYTKGEVDTKVQGAIDAIPEVDLEPYAKTETVNAAISGITTTLADKANTADVYTKTDADAKFQTEAQVDARISNLIDAANSEDTIKNVNDLVAYVNDNASDIAELVTKVNNTADDVAVIKAWKEAAVLPKASAEITMAEDGTLGLGEVSVNKLVQAAGDILVLNGGNAN